MIHKVRDENINLNNVVISDNTCMNLFNEYFDFSNKLKTTLECNPLRNDNIKK